MSEDRIIDRIRKMLALANDQAATEGERDNALRMAYATMAKHNIDAARVEATGTKEPRLNLDSEGWSMLWAKQMYLCMGELFFCKYYFGRKINGTKVIHHFVGKESNAVTASYMATFVVTSILKEGRGRGWHNLSAEMRSFALGAVNALWVRIQAMKAEATKTDSAPGTALVLASLYVTENEANEAFLAEQGMLFKKAASRRTMVNAEAYASGKEFGDKVNLNRQVPGAARTALE